MGVRLRTASFPKQIHVHATTPSVNPSERPSKESLYAPPSFSAAWRFKSPWNWGKSNKQKLPEASWTWVPCLEVVRGSSLDTPTGWSWYICCNFAHIVFKTSRHIYAYLICKSIPQVWRFNFFTTHRATSSVFHMFEPSHPRCCHTAR